MFVVVFKVKMGRGVHCTDVERELIKKLQKNGKSMAEIAKLLKCSKKKHFPQFTLHQKMKSEIESAKHLKSSTNFLFANQEKIHFLHRKT